MSNRYYLKLGYYTRVYPTEFLRQFQHFSKRTKNALTVYLIIKKVVDYFRPSQQYVTTTHTLSLSRYVSISFILKRKLRTCGSVAAVCAAILRKAGFPTKLIDGKLYASGVWRRHAWLEVYLEAKKKFIAIDPLVENFKVGKGHRRLGSYLDWRDLEKQTKRNK